MKTGEYLDQLNEGCEKLLRYTKGVSKDEFINNEEKRDAVYMVLIHVGETATRLEREHPEYVTRRSDAPWQAIKGLRNRLAHGYLDIDPGLIWKTVTDAVPAFQKKLNSYLEAKEDETVPD